MTKECSSMELVQYEQQLITQRELYKEKLTEGRTILAIILTSFSVFVAVNAALLKFAFDSTMDERVRPVMFIVGLLTSLVYLIACLFMWFVRRSILKDIKLIKEMSNALDFPKLSRLVPLVLVTIPAMLWTTLTVAGWIVLLKCYTGST